MKPDRETLQRLYEAERLSTRDIGKLYGVAHISVSRWLVAYGIPVRPTGRGLLNRGISEPSKNDLERLVHQEFRSYREIGEMYGVDFTAVPFWLAKHGIAKPDVWQSRRRKPKPQPQLSEVAEQYLAGQSIVELARNYGVADSTIRQWLVQSNVAIRRDGWEGGKRLTCNDGHEVRSTYELRVDDWLSEHGVEHIYEPILPFDRRYHADFLANGWFIEIWGVRNLATYEARTAKKRALYQAHDAPLIELPTWTFDSQNRGAWKRRLNRCLAPMLFGQPLND